MPCIKRHSITLRKRDVLIVSSEDLLPEMYAVVCRTPDNPNSILSLELSEVQLYSVFIHLIQSFLDSKDLLFYI